MSKAIIFFLALFGAHCFSSAKSQEIRLIHYPEVGSQVQSLMQVESIIIDKKQKTTQINFRMQSPEVDSLVYSFNLNKIYLDVNGKYLIKCKKIINLSSNKKRTIRASSKGDKFAFVFSKAISPDIEKFNIKDDTSQGWNLFDISLKKSSDYGYNRMKNGASADLIAKLEKESGGRPIIIEEFFTREEYENHPGIPGVLDVAPSFPGGLKALSAFVNSHITYPQTAVNQGIEGTVVLEFVVDTNGDVINIKVLKSVHPLLDEEAIRVLSLTPKWSPGILDGEVVKVAFTYPFIFNL